MKQKRNKMLLVEVYEDTWFYNTFIF